MFFPCSEKDRKIPISIKENERIQITCLLKNLTTMIHVYLQTRINSRKEKKRGEEEVPACLPAHVKADTKHDRRPRWHIFLSIRSVSDLGKEWWAGREDKTVRTLSCGPIRRWWQWRASSAAFIGRDAIGQVQHLPFVWTESHPQVACWVHFRSAMHCPLKKNYI